MCSSDLQLAFAQTDASKIEIDSQTGLIKDKNFALIEINCLACHGADLITNMKANRKTWLTTIRWMQASEGLWEIPPEDESRILDYLTEHYGERFDTRRRVPILILESR